MRSYRLASVNSRRQRANPTRDKRRFRKAIGRVLNAPGAAGPATAQKVAVQMGGELVHGLGDEIIQDLPR
jgi:hypothetical protein